MTKTLTAAAVLLIGWTASLGASAQAFDWGPETNTFVSVSALAQARARSQPFRVVIENCRRVSRTAQICRAGRYLLVDHAAHWQQRVRFEFVHREHADGGPLWWGQVTLGGGVLERLYITAGEVTVTRITRFPREGYTVSVPRDTREEEAELLH